MYRQSTAGPAAGTQNHPFGEVEIPHEILRDVSNLVGRLECWLNDVPYDRLVDKIILRDGVIDDPSVDGGLITVIPGDRKIACNRLTLAVSIGTSTASSRGFPRVMRTVRAHLIDCADIAKIVVLLTDTWNPRMNTEHFRDVVAHARKGRYVVPHLVSGKKISMVEWAAR